MIAATTRRPAGLTKNDPFLAMLRQAKARDFAPAGVLFDSGYSGLENRKAVRDCGWTFRTPRQAHRRVNPRRQGLRPVREAGIESGGTVVGREGSGEVRVFKVVSRDGDIESGATTDRLRDARGRWAGAERCWAIATDHRGLKQCCGVEQTQVRVTRAQRNPIGLAIRAFLRLEHHFYTTGIK
jgi:putative transposase